MKDKAALETIIRHHKDLYYNGQPEISDAKFDELFDELQRIDPKSPVVRSIGIAPKADDGWQKSKHEIPMGSLNKVSDEKEMTEWISKNCPDNVFVIEKIDGLSIECLYQNGKLTGAISRGDGEIGDQILSNVRKMQGVKEELFIPFTGSLRGEIILTRENHAAYFPDKANVRNTAAGVSRRLDGVGCKYLSVLFYQAIGSEEFDTEVDQLTFLEETLGLQVPYWQAFEKDSIKGITKVYQNYIVGFRDALSWEIDGLVLKLNDLSAQEAMGEHDNRPKGAMAYKFPTDKKETILKEVVWQLGNSGRISPVAVFETINLAGAKVQNASLFNIKRIKELGIEIGDTILVSRRGDVIPNVESKVSDGQDRKSISGPERCPYCGGEVGQEGENFICIETDICEGQIIGRLHKWITTIGVLEWGDKLLTKIVDNGLANDVADLYNLTVEDLSKIERMGKKSAEKCIALLHEKKELPLEVFLGSLSIPNAAVSTIKFLIDAGYDNVEKILEASDEDFKQVKGIGPTKAKDLDIGLAGNEPMIRELLKHITIKEKASGGLCGKKIAITGKTTMKRADLQRTIAEAGGEYKGSVSKETTHLVIADPNSDSVKAQGARKMGITLITEDQLMEMIE